MNKFIAIQPSLLLTPFVKQYWFLTIDNIGYNSQRIIPFGYPTLSFYRRGFSVYSLFETDFLPQSHLSAITTDFTDIFFEGNVNMVCIVFQPAGVRAIFNMSLADLSKSYTSIDSLQGADLYDLEQRIDDAVDDESCIEFIEHFLFHRIGKYGIYKENRLINVFNSIEEGESDIDKLAQTACLSYKQFKRIFLEYVGINPKEYLQIVRFQKLYHLLQQQLNIPLEQLAVDCGYYDKSHLIKDLKNKSGFIPSKLSEACDKIYSKEHFLFRSAFVDLFSE